MSIPKNRFNDKVLFWKSKGMLPKVIYDIGANVGDWSRNFKKIYPDASYELFEASPKYKNAHPEFSSHTTLLGKEAKIVPFYTIINGFDTGDSMFLEVSNAFGSSNYKTIELPCIRLDDYMKERGLQQPDLIKIDVQGAELDVLIGGKDTLSNTKYCMLECSLHRWNKDAPMIEEVIQYMFQNDFYLVDILDEHIIQGYLAQVDLLFAHKSTNLRRENFYN